MKILLIGNGGREHALGWKLAQSPAVKTIYVAPGNAGTAQEAKLENVAIAANDLDGLLAFALDQSIDLTVVGPEEPLVKGIVDLFQANELRCFGPSKAAAQLEGSKSFCKDFLKRYNIPTAAYQTFTEVAPAVDFLKTLTAPYVLKADGLAAGKGVIIAQTLEEATEALGQILEGNQFGEAGHKVVIEEFLHGEEASYICMVDCKNILPMASSQDHKARDNGDVGPNTGGMGAYSPAPVVTDAVEQTVLETIIRPTVNGLIEDGTPFTGFLYAGLMIDDQGIPRVIEYNCRFGDPETQPILSRLNSDLVKLINAALDQSLDTAEAQWDPRPSLAVVMAAGGYPFSYKKGDVIQGLDLADSEVKVFHAGTQTAIQEDGSRSITTNGGRVLAVVAMGDTIQEAQSKAYRNIQHISWENAYYRTDIGHRAVDP